MNCAQVKEQLIDFLYDELTPAARAAFAEHLQGCPACTAEVAGYQNTLGSARTALGGPLLQEPPARVHLAVLEAAKAAAKQSASTQGKASAPRANLGFFARLLRTPWFLPAFGAASIATVVFLVRVLKNPEVLPGQYPHAIEERAIATPEPVAPPRQAVAVKHATAPAAAGDDDKSLAKKKTIQGLASSLGGQGKRKAPAGALGVGRLSANEGQAGASRRFAEPPSPRPAGAKSSKDIDDLLGGYRETERAHDGALHLVAPAGGKSEQSPGEAARLEGQAQEVAAPPKKTPQNEPAGMARPAARSPESAMGAPAAPAPRGMRDYPAPASASAPAPVAKPSVVHKRTVQADEEAKGSIEETDDLARARSATKAKSAETSGPSLGESIRKAERLYASQDWNAAAAAYRDLLNRFPSYKDAPKWRERMSESTVAYQRTLEAKRKKAASDDPLSGSMK